MEAPGMADVEEQEQTGDPPRALRPSSGSVDSVTSSWASASLDDSHHDRQASRRVGS